jgi:hypothetical protein
MDAYIPAIVVLLSMPFTGGEIQYFQLSATLVAKRRCWIGHSHCKMAAPLNRLVDSSVVKQLTTCRRMVRNNKAPSGTYPANRNVNASSLRERSEMQVVPYHLHWTCIAASHRIYISS